jgi:hypothetical protein
VALAGCTSGQAPLVAAHGILSRAESDDDGGMGATHRVSGFRNLVPPSQQ